MNGEEYLKSLTKEDIVYIIEDYIFNYQDDIELDGWGNTWEHIRDLVLKENKFKNESLHS